MLTPAQTLEVRVRHLQREKGRSPALGNDGGCMHRAFGSIPLWPLNPVSLYAAVVLEPRSKLSHREHRELKRQSEREMVRLIAEALTRDAFAPYGDVIDETGPEQFPTNEGEALRVHAMGEVDCSAENGRAILSLFRMTRANLDGGVRLMERHPISSQAFVPLNGCRFVVVVANTLEPPSASALRAFVSNGTQGVNYHRGIWHHPLIALGAGDFLVVDRTARGAVFDQDYEESVLDDECFLVID